MRKVVLLIVIVLAVVALIAAWILVGSGTGFSSKSETLYISSNAATQKAVMDSIRSNKIVSNTGAFEWLAARMGVWERIRPGRYVFDKGTGLLTILRRIKNGSQTPLNLTITKLRTKEDLARMTGSKFEFDSLAMIRFLNNGDSLQEYGVDTAKAMTVIIPDTYTFFWNTTPEAVYKKIYQASRKFWTEERKQKAAGLGLDPQRAYILASIVEEETTNEKEKGTIASVYLNRLEKGMPLQADPTVKFAMRNFALKRIYEKYLMVESPYNTYRNKGLPPGPICTPSRKTIDAVLDAPQTEFIYFVADPAKRETHDFSVTYEEHLRKAKVYQEALNKRDSLKGTSR